VEQAAVNHIEKALAQDLDDGYLKIIQIILPHEKARASLYPELYTR